jgi:hypothetical protein
MRTSSRAFGSLTYNRMTPAAKAFVRSLNSSVKRPWFISDFQISAFYFGFPRSQFLFSDFPWRHFVPVNSQASFARLAICLMRVLFYSHVRGVSFYGRHAIHPSLPLTTCRPVMPHGSRRR